MRLLSRFKRNISGNIALITAIAIPILAGIVLGGVSLGVWSGQKSAAQDMADAAALAGAALYANPAVTPAQIEAAARSSMTANLNKQDQEMVGDAIVESDPIKRTVTVSYSGLAKGTLSSPIWNGLLTIKVSATARWGTKPEQVCILITEPFDNHTLRSSGDAKVVLNKCMVQVNTANWDAVEAAGSSSIHVNDGKSCFVGNIHFGDVTPAKTENCTFFPDPFDDMTVSAPGSCTVTDFNTASNGSSLSPGVYCGGIQVTTDASFAPGLYYIKDGPLKVVGDKTDISAEGVTFIFMGEKTGIEVRSGGVWNQTASTKANGGQYAGFVFFLDPASREDAKSSSKIQGMDLNLKGIIYLVGQKLLISNGSNVTMNPGSIVADYLLPQGGNLTLNGDLSTTTASEISMRKSTVEAAVIAH